MWERQSTARPLAVPKRVRDTGGVSIDPTAGASHTVVAIDPLFGPEGAAAMVDLCERFGSYGMYSQEYVESEIGKGLSQRHDAAMNFVRTGGRFAREEPI